MMSPSASWSLSVGRVVPERGGPPRPALDTGSAVVSVFPSADSVSVVVRPRVDAARVEVTRFGGISDDLQQLTDVS
jgi:hypothetical protein